MRSDSLTCAACWYTQAKKFVESLPKVVKENATKEESDKLAALFKAIGAETTAE